MIIFSVTIEEHATDKGGCLHVQSQIDEVGDITERERAQAQEFAERSRPILLEMIENIKAKSVLGTKSYIEDKTAESIRWLHRDRN